MQDLVCGLFDQASHIGRQVTNPIIHPCCGFLDQGQRV